MDNQEHAEPCGTKRGTWAYRGVLDPSHRVEALSEDRVWKWLSEHSDLVAGSHDALDDLDGDVVMTDYGRTPRITLRKNGVAAYALCYPWPDDQRFHATMEDLLKRFFAVQATVAGPPDYPGMADILPPNTPET